MTTRRDFLKTIGLAAASFVLPGCGAPFQSRPPKKKHPNVLVFYTDDQGTLDVNCYGSKDLYTPNMDSLAGTGVRFTQPTESPLTISMSPSPSQSTVLITGRLL
jgi:hypothetical protein